MLEDLTILRSSRSGGTHGYGYAACHLHSLDTGSFQNLASSLNDIRGVYETFQELTLKYRKS